LPARAVARTGRKSHDRERGTADRQAREHDCDVISVIEDDLADISLRAVLRQEEPA
jgi:hypothetical protein